MKTNITIQQQAEKPVRVQFICQNKLERALCKTVRYILEEADSICERDPAALGRAEVLLMYSGVHAVMFYRIAHMLNDRGLVLSARALSQLARFLTGVEIHPGATIGKGLFIDHGSGVVIGETAIIGDYCTIYQGVTLGGTGKQTGKRHPTLGNNVMVGSGAKLLGNFTVGDNAKIASGAVVLGDIPANSTAVGVPAKVVRKDGAKVVEREHRRPSSDLDQVHIPDPVENEITSIARRLEAVEALLREKENETP
ncbi:MAG: serine O-acetyltransferase [Ruminococcaceae bacterium]|nr:serine O-acetyltransferase [Oscillospiraceae bacterium]